ncbi:MAG: thioredoxin family protein, partial [Nocardioides sp.]
PNPGAERPPQPPKPSESVLSDTSYDEHRGERATLLQFSSAFCAPCRATRRVLGEVAAVVPGAVHLEIDAEQHLDLVRRLGVLRTPTTLVLDPAGREVTRAAGTPRKEQVLAVLASGEPAR